MSHMLCTCGHDMPDNTDKLPYAGFAYVLRDQSTDQFWDEVYQDIASFATALAEDRRDAWITERFGERYPHGLANPSVLEDLITGLFGERSLALFQCENCGRLWVQEELYSSLYRPFHPEGEWRDTLAVKKTDKSAQSGDGQERTT